MTLNLNDLISQGGSLAVIGILLYIIINDRKCHMIERKESADMVLGAREQYKELAEDVMQALTANQTILSSVSDAINRLTESLALDRRLSRIEAGLGKTPGEGNGKEDKL